MKYRQLFKITPFLLMGLFLVFATSCDKEDDDNNIDNGDNTEHEYGEMTDDRDGKKYKTIQIGDQEWMAENLAYLPSVVDQGTGSASKAYYYVYDYYGTDVAAAKATVNYTTYGVLYNWSAAMNGAESSSANPSGVQGVCPTGWHLPSDAEWTELTDYLGGKGSAGVKLKAIGTIEAGTGLWYEPNAGATNETGFSALPGGIRYEDDGTFNSIGYEGSWWSASDYSSYRSWFWILHYHLRHITRYDYGAYNAHGCSVRCLKD